MKLNINTRAITMLAAKIFSKKLTTLAMCTVTLFTGVNLAHGEVDKLYHPYVEYNTYEFEARIISQLDNELASDFSIYRFGFGKDISENLFLELYLIGAKDSQSRVELEAYEIEALYQLSEQGEYWADLGLLMEIEKEKESNEWEGNIGIIIEKEFGRWSGTFNFQNQYVFEDDVKHEWKLNSALQFRYRMQATFEPGFEIYSSSGSLAFGPVILGQVRLSNSKINWELGLMKETRGNAHSSVLRALFEYEF